MFPKGDQGLLAFSFQERLCWIGNPTAKAVGGCQFIKLGEALDNFGRLCRIFPIQKFMSTFEMRGLFSFSRENGFFALRGLPINRGLEWLPDPYSLKSPLKQSCLRA